MSARPKISVVTISRNSAATIERTIRSVLDQAYPDLEYIVIDGGSTDGTADVIARHAGSLAHWVSEPDRGISHAFNKGIAAAHGELVGILNADDWYEPGALAAIAAAHEGGGADVLYGDLALPGARVQRGDALFAQKIPYTMPTLNHPTCFVRASAYRRFGVYRERYRVAMDYDLLRRFHALGATFRRVDAVIASMSAGGASHTLLLRRYAELLEIAGYHPKAFGYVARHVLMSWAERARSVNGGVGGRTRDR
jgi:glycosyltransferase involved in cell wall biosynthesis